MALVRVLVVAAVQAMEKRPRQVLQQKATPLMLLVQLLLGAAQLVSLLVLLLQLATLLRASQLVSLLVLLQVGAVLMILQAATVIVTLQVVTLLLTAEQEQMPVPHLGGQVPVQLSVMRRRALGSTLTSCQEMVRGQPE